MTLAGGHQKVSRQHNVDKYTNKKRCFAVSAGTCKAARITNPVPPPLLKHSKYMTKHDTVGHIQFPFAQIPLLSCSMLHLDKEKRLMV